MARRPQVLKLRHTGSPNAGGGVGAMWGEDVSFTLSTTQDQTLFQAVDFRNANVSDADDPTGTLQAKGDGGYSLNFQSGVTDGYVVRRITPLEAERLQGFPDGWTDVPWKGKEHPPDSRRYKAIGNSMAVNVMRLLGTRIQEVQDLIDKQEEGGWR